MSRYEITEKIVAMSKVYQHGKTQIPKEVRKELGLEDGDKVLWIIMDGKLIVKRA